MSRKLLLEKAHIEGIRFYEAYRSNGGYAAVEKAFKMSPADIVEEVKKSGLRGRGGAGFPTGYEMEFSWQSLKVFPVTLFAMQMKVSPELLKTGT